MNFKKFISGVSAFAIAASAFAAMAVTASATDYNESITLGAGNGYNIANYNSNGVATAKTGITYAALRADLSELTDIEDATSVTVEFDAATYQNNVVAFGFGDAAQRTTIADGSGNFKTGGLAMFFGSVNGSEFRAYDVKSGSNKNIGSGFFGKVVHAKVRFNKEPGTYDYELSQGSNKLSQTGIATDIGNLTYVEAYTKTAGAQMMFKNIKVSYTVEDAPAVTTEAGFTYKTTIEKLTTGTVSLTIEATDGETTQESTVDITDKLEGFAGDLMLAVVIDEIPEGITITSASISLD